MQVRSIEFQENFRIVANEASRQHNLVQREPETARHQAAVAVGQEQTLNLSRPREATELEGLIVDPDVRGESGGRSRGRRSSQGKQEGNTGSEGGSPLPRGSVVDVTA